MLRTGPGGRRVGDKLPPKLDPRTLRMARYLPALLPAPPAMVDHASLVPTWPWYKNNEYGTCGPAAAAHAQQAWRAYAQRGLTPPDEAQVVADYFAITGGRDTGVYALDMMNFWRKQGIGGDRIEAFVSINPNQTELELAIAHFTVALIGLSLPDDGTYGPWDRVYGRPNPNKGHMVLGVWYDRVRKLWKLVSWGGLMDASTEFLLYYMDEGYAAANDLALIEASMTTAEGYTWPQLTHDLTHLGDPITPDPDPNQPPVEPPVAPRRPTWWEWCVIAAIVIALAWSLVLRACRA